jgi:hypothetical protein
MKLPADAFGHELSRPKRISWRPVYRTMCATIILVSCGGVKTNVFIDVSYPPISMRDYFY